MTDPVGSTPPGWTGDTSAVTVIDWVATLIGIGGVGAVTAKATTDGPGCTIWLKEPELVLKFISPTYAAVITCFCALNEEAVQLAVDAEDREPEHNVVEVVLSTKTTVPVGMVCAGKDCVTAAVKTTG